MINPASVAIGKEYRNIKTGSLYEVVLISQNSENPVEFLVSYSKDEDDMPWSRPLHLFATKFEEVENAPA